MTELNASTYMDQAKEETFIVLKGLGPDKGFIYLKRTRSLFWVATSNIKDAFIFMDVDDARGALDWFTVNDRNVKLGTWEIQPVSEISEALINGQIKMESVYFTTEAKRQLKLMELVLKKKDYAIIAEAINRYYNDLVKIDVQDLRGIDDPMPARKYPNSF